MAYITNNIFLGGITHRQMRLCLLKEFDDIYIFNLHGDLYEKDNKSKGGIDENVFDITKGVSINIFVKTGKKQKDELGKVHYEELIDSRKIKFTYLEEANLSSVEWKELQPEAPYYFFVPKNFEESISYDHYFKLGDLMPNHSNGIVSGKDKVNFWKNQHDVEFMLEDLVNMPAEKFRQKYDTGPDSQYWNIERAREDVINARKREQLIIQPILFRPFDKRYFTYTGKTNGIVQRPLPDISKQMLFDNIGLIVPRQTKLDWRHVFVCTEMIDGNLTSSARLYGAGQLFPLYVAKERDGILQIVPNINESVLSKIEEGLDEQIVPEELFDYIYAVLHSPSYRQRYNEFLKIDFPRIPYPTDATLYHDLAKKGKELRQLHLMDGSDKWDCETGFPVTEGDNNVAEVKYDEAHERVYINKVRYFSDVPKSAWDFFIGGYQPAQKWLKDRKNHLLTGDDVEHYEQIIHALLHTERVMNEIDEIYAQEDP